MVSADDFDRLMQVAWVYERGYARQYMNGRMFYLHRIIVNAPQDKYVDHINGNRLDNRRENLRLCNASQNAMNSDVRRDSTSGYTGVYLNKQRQQWQAMIRAGGKTYHYGFYDDIEEAISARLLAESEHFGVFAWA